jgi:cell division protein FtsL
MPVIEQRSVKNFNGVVPRERDARQWRRCLSSVVVGILMVVGFAIAAQQHFAAHEFSVENVKLQREREQLKIEQKRLLLERETALSLDRLKRKAEKIGLQGPTVNQISQLPAVPENAEAEGIKTYIFSTAKIPLTSDHAKTKNLR